jgi:membrane-bound serine protease (ClpP class)
MTMYQYSVLASIILLGLTGLSQGATIVLMDVMGTIDLGLAPYTRRVLQEAENLQAAAVILHINTPGGRVDAAIQMRDALLDAQVDTIAFIDKEAYSAGALIALASQKIYMTGGAVIGAATPVNQQGQKVGEKYVSAIRKLFRATAEQNGRPPEIAEAMVDEDVAIPNLIEKGKLLTLTTQEALQWKVADGQIDTLEALLTHLNFSQASLIRIRPNWAESLIRVLTQPSISALLLLIGLLGLWGEFLSPGLGIGGVIGATSLALLLGSHYLVGLVGWEEVLLIGAGILLLALEILIIPGFGVAGVLGILVLGAGLFLSFLGSYPPPSEIWRVSMTMLMVFALVAVGAVVMFMLLPTTPIWSRLSLKTTLKKPPSSASSQGTLPASPWLGVSGITVTPLSPSGTGLFQGKRLDITSEGEYIPADTPVTIIHVVGNRPVVRPKHLRQLDQGETNHEGVS